jgi:hypothetical protein
VFKTIPSESWSYLIALQFLIGRVSLLKLEQERLSFLSIFRINKAITFSDLDMGVSGAAQIECHVSHLLHYRFHAELLSLHKAKDNRRSDTDSLTYMNERVLPGFSLDRFSVALIEHYDRESGCTEPVTSNSH